MVYGKVEIHSPEMHTAPRGGRCKMDRVDESTANSNGRCAEKQPNNVSAAGLPRSTRSARLSTPPLFLRCRLRRPQDRCADAARAQDFGYGVFDGSTTPRLRGPTHFVLGAHLCKHRFREANGPSAHNPSFAKDGGSSEIYLLIH